jgi:murein L,D-transpeptidase YafK
MTGDSFKEKQSSYPRVKAALADKEAELRGLFASKGLNYPPRRIYIRAFKQERALELWIEEKPGSRYRLLKKYSFCTSSGGPGPKREIGDGQIPEGFYYVDRFNPVSNFHLSLGLNYPNESDRILGVQGRLGGDIFIHGGCASIGCVPITDEGIKELYIIAVQAHSAGQTRIPAHIFPRRFVGSNADVKPRSGESETTRELWNSLRRGFEYFETHRRPPQVTVDRRGRYVL